MQPESNQPVNVGPEQVPMPPTFNGERIPSLPPIDAGIERGAERREQAAEAGARAADAAAPAYPVATPQPVAPVPQTDPVQAPASNNPIVAADEDLIEKEWVDKAKEIIQQTKDDPHARTQKVNELQRDYLQKRYGRAIGVNE